MIPFDKIYSWLFKSFNISGETEMIDRLITKNKIQEIMVIKRSWIFALFMLWIPIVILILSGLSIWIAIDSIQIPIFRNTLVIGNILMSCILIWSTISYIAYYSSIHQEAHIVRDMKKLKDELALGDRYFRSFFNWSITNQLILVLIIVAEIFLVLIYGKLLWWHFWVLVADTFVIILEIAFLRHFRKKMMDLEMDYNIVIPGKIFFVNQSGILSNVHTVEANKIKTVQSLFPSKIASFFNYGSIHILTEGDTQMMMGTMSMHYVTNPDGVVASIQTLVGKDISPADAPEKSISTEAHISTTKKDISDTQNTRHHTPRHTLDTREKIRAVIHK